MSLKTVSLNESSVQAKTLEGGMLLAMLKLSTAASAKRTTWPTSYSALSITTSRPVASETFVESKSPKMSDAPTDFSKLRINTGPPQKSGQKPRSPTSISDIATLTTPTTYTTSPLAKTRLSMAHITETPHVLMTPHFSDARIPVMPHVPETSRTIMTPPIPDGPLVPETSSIPAQLVPKKNLGKIVCKKCNRLLDRARRCCGTYSVALCIRVEHIPERYRPRVACKGAIRAHFPSFAKAARYRMFLSCQMRKKRKLRFLVEFEDSGENSRKRQRNCSMQKIPTSNSIKTSTHMTGFNTSNFMGGFSQSFSHTIPWQMNQHPTFGYGLTQHGLTSPIGTISRDKVLKPPPD